MSVDEIKVFFTRNAEKVICFLLAGFLVFFLGYLFITLMKESSITQGVVEIEKILDAKKEDNLHAKKVDDYDALITSIQKVVDYMSLHNRNFFVPFVADRKTEDAMEILVCWSCRTKLSLNTSVCPVCGAVQKNVDQDKDGMPDYWENKYGFNPVNPDDASLDEDSDSYSNVEEYRYNTDPLDADSNPKALGIVGRFFVKRIFRKPVKLKLMGYINLADGITLQINWHGKTDFKKLGESIRGYNVIDFTKKIVPVKTKTGLEKDIDQSFATIQKANENPVMLEIKKIKIEKELYATIVDSDNDKQYEVFVGKVLAREFEILDISEKEVIILDKEGKKYTLRVKRS